MNTRSDPEIKALSKAEQEEVFRLATRGLVHFFGDKFARGMTDKELEDALVSSLGIFGGSSSPDRVSVCYKGSGLKIWGGRHCINHVLESPLFEGNITLKMARDVYEIANPDEDQMMLF